MEQEAQKIVDNFQTKNQNGAFGSKSAQDRRGESNSNTTHTLSEVADFLEINESTLRNWERRFAEFLSNYRNQYNHRVFTDKDVKVLERVKGLMESGLFTQAGVKHMLGNQGDINLNQSAPVRSQQVSALDESYKEKLLLALNSLGSEVHALRREMRDDLKGSLKRDLEHLTLLLFPPEKPVEKRPWWRLW
ncbi:MAG: MerR family transcriptional regulator [Patescibacteria group bacterium]|nr:MerR family transcriptional regulator [Patescibacteria group bacterium]